MSDTTTSIRDVLVVDRGPVRDAALILAYETTLSEHVDVRDGMHVTELSFIDGDVPFELWGSGTQALWRLLSSIAYTGESVSLYEVVSRLDRRNSAAVARAVAALCGA